VADDVVSISTPPAVCVLITIFDLEACALGNVAPVQLNVTIPATAVTPAFNVTVNVFDAKAAVFPNADGDVNVQTGVAGHVKPVNPTVILPAAEIVDAVVALTVTVTVVEDCKLLSNVTAAFVITPKTALIVPVTDLSISTDAAVCVRKLTSVLANCADGKVAPVQVRVIAPAAIELVPTVIVNIFDAKTDDAGSAVPAGAVNLHTGVAGHVKPVKVVRIFPDAGTEVAVVAVIVTVTPEAPAEGLLNVTAPPVIAPRIGGSEPSTAESIATSLEYLVTI